MKNFLPVVFCGLFLFTFSQPAKYRIVSIPVERHNALLRQPWVGGMNSPQFSAIDLNGDSYKDLYVFDRTGDKVLTYINNGSQTDTAFEYAPKYEQLFPTSTAWALIRDYNNDGVPDVFAHTNTGTMVFKGSMQNGILHFDTVSQLLMFTDPPYHVNIWTNISDIPVFTDVNFDGDIDVLTYGVFGAAVEYYENQTVEHAGDPHYAADSLKYVNVTTCWGEFAQSGVSNSIALNISCKGGSGLSQPEGSRHSGNTIYSFDNDNDHDVDLLNGNIGYDNLMFLENGGDSTYAHVVTWDSVFPSCNVPVVMPTYPAAFGIDADNDGLDDLLISPNVYSGGRDVKNVLLYKNINNQVCNFQPVCDSFIVQDMLDFGTDSKPVFFDWNGDGLKDIVVGHFGYFRPFQTYQTTVAIYQNIGTASSPKFKMITEDYNNFSNYGLVGMHPSFGDLDGDGADDMLLGELNGYLHYFKNTGGANAAFPVMTTPQFSNIDVGQNSAPFIYDMNGDSLLDIVVGRKDGKISYYWNYGTKTIPLFHKDSVNAFLGNINVTESGSNEGNAQPFVWRTDGGALKLLVGTNRGTVYQYAVNSGNLRSGSFTLEDSDFLKQDIGSKAVIAVTDLNHDGWQEYLLGNSRGGLLLYSDSLWDPGTLLSSRAIFPDKEHLQIYPNPAHDYFVCIADGLDKPIKAITVYNMLGEPVPVALRQEGSRIVVNSQGLPAGFYIVRIQQADNTFTGKVLVE